jgi:hypothetical protein
MIHYNVWFSFTDGAAEADQLLRVRSFLDDLKSRDPDSGSICSLERRFVKRQLLAFTPAGMAS